MKYLETETISQNEVKENVLYVFGGSKKAWLGYFEGGFFWTASPNKLKKKMKLKPETVFLLKETQFNTNQFENAYQKFDKEWFVALKESLIQKRTKYTGAILTEQSHDLLVRELVHLIPMGWNVVAHHMTLCLGDLSEELTHLIGTKHTLTVKSYSIDTEKGVMAVAVESELESHSAYKHITIALAEGARAVQSNELTEFTEVKASPVETVVCKVLNNQELVSK